MSRYFIIISFIYSLFLIIFLSYLNHLITIFQKSIYSNYLQQESNLNNQRFNNFTCGKKESRKKRIINGKNAENNSWPWEVKIMYRNSFNRDEFLGSGCLINQNFVLTSNSMLLSFLNNTQISVKLNSINIPVQKIIKYPGFNLENFLLTPNVALLKLNEKIEPNQNHLPVCLPDQYFDFFNKITYVVGWGMTNRGSYAVLPNYLQESRFILLNETDKRCNEIKNYNKSIFLCGLGLNKNANVCFGDSSLYINVNNTWYVYGVLSFMRAKNLNCNQKKPSYFTKIQYVLRWIKKEIETY